MREPRPIFVLGLQRSGTTWAANLLAAHPQIAAVTAERHRGVHESVFFSHFARIFGDWSDPAARHRAIEAFLDSDYVHLTGLAPDRARSLVAPCSAPACAFRAIMNSRAERQGASAWVEKSPHHTLLAEDIAVALPDAVFLCVSRDSESLVRSRLWSYGRTPPPYPGRAVAILRACASNIFHARHMARLGAKIGPERVFGTTYAALQKDPDAAVAPLLSALGLAPLGGRRPQFSRNSSFASEAARASALGPSDRLLVRVGTVMTRALPGPVLAVLQRRMSARRPTRFPAWVFPPQTGRTGPT